MIHAQVPWQSFRWDGDYRNIPNWAAADAYDRASAPGVLFVRTRLKGEHPVLKGEVIYEFDLKCAFEERQLRAERCGYAFP